MKLLLICLLVVLIMIVALGIAKQYKQKCNFYADLVLFFNSYEINIGFKKEKMLLFVKNFNCSFDSKFLFDSYIQHLENDKPLNFKSSLIDDSDVVEEMFACLGHNDYEQELKKINSYKVYLQKKLDEAEQKKEKNCPLIVKLSFLLSLVLGIVLI